MKRKLLSAILATVLLLLAMPVVEITAEATGSGYQNTAELFNAELGTVYATRGTPELGTGNTDGWKDAYSFTVRTLYKKDGTDSNGMDVKIGGTAYKAYYTYIVYSVMWDDNHLYILENRPYDTIQYMASPAGNYNWANWSAGGIDMTSFGLVLPTDIDAGAQKYGANNLIYIGTGVEETDATGTVKDSIRQARVAKFNGSGGNSKENYTDFLGKFNVVDSKTTRTAYGFYTETAIPWSVLDDYNKDTFVASAGKTLGLALSINANNANCDTYPDANENRNFRPLQLTEQNPTAPYIEPDFSWYTNSVDKKEFVLEDEADLMGLNLLMSYGIEEKHSKNPYANHHLKELYPLCTQGHWGGRNNILLNGRTVKLAKDMDLNVGWLADGSGKTLANEWAPIALYEGIFDGQGHSIRGISTIPNLRYVQYYGFFSYISTGSSVTDLALQNGVIRTMTDNVTATGGVAGALIGESKTAPIILRNIVCSLDVSGKNADENVGGIIAINNGGANGMITTLENCTYAGTVSNSANNWVGAITVTSDDTKSSLRAINCVYTGTASDLALYRWAINNDKTIISGNFAQTKTAEDGSVSLRLVGVLNNKNKTYKAETLTRVGYNVVASMNGATSGIRSMRTGSVYESVITAGETIKAKNLGGDSLYALVIQNIPSTGTVTLTVTVVYLDAEGNEVQPLPEPLTVIIRDGELQ